MFNSAWGQYPMYLQSSGSGYPVLFIHGVPTSCHLWNDVINDLAGRFTCLAVDLPGLGRTPGTAQGLRALDSMAASIDQLRIQCGIKNWHVVGHDAGCAVAVHYAHRFEQHVGCLALISPSIFPDLKPFYLFEILRTRIIGELMAPAISLIFWEMVMRTVLEGHVDRRGLVNDFRAPFGGIAGAWRLMSLMRWGDPADVLASIPGLLPQLLAPTLIFHGSRDQAIPEVFARRAKDLIPNSELMILDCGHFVPLSHAGIVAKELRRFFENSGNEFVSRSASPTVLPCKSNLQRVKPQY